MIYMYRKKMKKKTINICEWTDTREKKGRKEKKWKKRIEGRN